MKNLSESNKKLISELVSDLEVSLIGDKKQCHSDQTNEDIEKEINEVFLLLLEDKRTVGRSSGSTSVGQASSSQNVGRGSSARKTGVASTARKAKDGVRRSIQRVASRVGGNRGETFGRISNALPDSRLENQNIDPGAMRMFTAFWNELKDKGYEPFVTSGHRMPSHQRDLYDSGTGHQTAQPCRSDHQYGFALDINVNLPPDEDGNVASARAASSNNTWEPIVDIAHDKGLAWQGRKDRVHFYVPGRVTSRMKKDCKDFFGDIDINSRGVAQAMQDKENEDIDTIKNILKIA